MTYGRAPARGTPQRRGSSDKAWLLPAQPTTFALFWQPACAIDEIACRELCWADTGAAVLHAQT